MWLECLFSKKLDIGKVGSMHEIRIENAEYKGTYCSVWFNSPNWLARPNISIPDAPKYYIDFVWRPYLDPYESKVMIDSWLRKHGLKVAKWRKAYHFKYFYQATIGEIDGKEVGDKKAELWCEANYDTVNEKFDIKQMKVKKRAKVLVGLPHYKDRIFRVVGISTEHPLGFWIIILRSDLVHQLLVWR